MAFTKKAVLINQWQALLETLPAVLKGQNTSMQFARLVVITCCNKT